MGKGLLGGIWGAAKKVGGVVGKQLSKTKIGKEVVDDTEAVAHVAEEGAHLADKAVGNTAKAVTSKTAQGIYKNVGNAVKNGAGAAVHTGEAVVKGVKDGSIKKAVVDEKVPGSLSRVGSHYCQGRRPL